VSLAMALMVSHLRKANGLVPFGAIWCLCCCTCGSLLAKVNWQNGSVYCSERLVKRPKKISDSLLLCEYPEVSTHASDCQCPRPRTSWNRMLQTYQVARTWVTWAGDNFSTCFFLCSFHDMRSCMGMGQT
jgi:hypothetical protein